MIRFSKSRIIKLSCLLVLSIIICNYYYEHQRQLATRNVMEAIEEMESIRSMSPQPATILEPSQGHRCQGSGSGLFLLVMVISSPGNVERRQVIRSTWREMGAKWEQQFFLDKDKDSHQSPVEVTRVTQVLFFLGQSSSNHVSSDELTSEWNQHGDLVVDNFHDSYLTLTWKTLRMIEWATRNCPEAQYVVKMDDDVFLHVPKLLRRLLNVTDSTGSKVILGHVYRDKNVIRSPFSKWFAPESVYSNEIYPAYMSGACYVLGMSAALEVLKESRSLPLYHLEDLFVTGILANKILQIPLVDIGPVWIADSNQQVRTTSLQWILQHVYIHQVTMEQFRCWTKFTTVDQSQASLEC